MPRHCKKKWFLAGISILTLSGSVTMLCNTHNTYAAPVYPGIEIKIGASGNGCATEECTAALNPNGDNNDATFGIIKVPISVEFTNTNSYSIGVSLQCESLTGNSATACTTYSALIGNASGSILKGTTTSAMASSLTNAWGFHADKTGAAKASSTWNYDKVPSAQNTTNIVATNATDNREGLINGHGTRNLNLYFAAKVNGDQAADSYSGNILITAVAQPREIVDFESIENFQAFGADTCSEIETGTEGVLRDTRDNKTYLVKKLADGQCWMMQNLALEGGTTITAAESDVSRDFTLSVSSQSIANRWNNGSITGHYMFNGSHQNATMNTNVTDINTTANTGSYYSYMEATAGTGNSASGEASESICPKGWKLPSREQFSGLYESYNEDYQELRDAFNIAFTGYCASDGCPSHNSTANYWSRSIYSNTNAYKFYEDAAQTIPNSRDEKYLGQSIRCVATTNDTRSVSTMQEATSELCSRNPINVTTALSDSRDNKQYLIKRMADGNCWMVQNLALAGETHLTTKDSDVNNNNFSLSASSSITSGRWNNEETTSNYMYNGTHLDARKDTPIITNNETTYNTGGYYSYMEATAGTGGSSTGEADSSICPKNWRLPSKQEYEALISANSSASSFYLTFNVASTWYCSRFGCPSVGNTGTYWSRSIRSDTSSYNLYASENDVNPNYDKKNIGLSVRCLLVSQ